MTNISKYVFGKKVTAQSAWNPPGDWIDISDVNDNEINLLVGDFGIPTIAFACTIAAAGTYSINWGDGTVETLRASTTTYQHSYTPGAGQACSLGYTTFKIRIYEATGNITAFAMKRHNVSTQTQYASLLWAVFGTSGLTSLANAFYDATIRCPSLQSVVLPSVLDSLTSLYQTFQTCYSLCSVTLPTSMSALQTLYQTFYACYNLQTIILPTTLTSLTGAGLYSTFYACYSLQNLSMPTSVGAVTSCESTFNSCYLLKSVALPSLTSVTTINSMFIYCYSLTTVTGLSTLGRTGAVVVGTDFMKYCEMVTTDISLNAFLYNLGIYGASGKLNKVTSIRLTNAGSTFTSPTTPQVNVSYTSLDAAALNALFGDLPSVAKTIEITGATGAATCDKTIATLKGWTVTG